MRCMSLRAVKGAEMGGRVRRGGRNGGNVRQEEEEERR